jgi:hypothetical protein
MKSHNNIPFFREKFVVGIEAVILLKNKINNCIYFIFSVEKKLRAFFIVFDNRG